MSVSVTALLLLLLVVLKVGDWRLIIGYLLLFLACVLLPRPWSRALHARTTRLWALASAVLPTHRRPTWLSRLAAAFTAAWRVLMRMDPRSEFEQAPRWALVCAIACGVLGVLLLVASIPVLVLGGLSVFVPLLFAGPTLLALAVAVIYVGLTLQTGLEIVRAVQAAWRDPGLGSETNGDEAGAD